MLIGGPDDGVITPWQSRLAMVHAIHAYIREVKVRKSFKLGKASSQRLHHKASSRPEELQCICKSVQYIQHFDTVRDGSVGCGIDLPRSVGTVFLVHITPVN